MLDTINTRQKLSIACFIMAKMAGMLGFATGFTGKFLKIQEFYYVAWTLVIADIILLAASVYFAVKSDSKGKKIWVSTDDSKIAISSTQLSTLDQESLWLVDPRDGTAIRVQMDR